MIILAVISSATSIATTIINKNTNKKIELMSELKADFKKEMTETRNDFKNEMTEMKVENAKTYLTDFLSDLNNGEHKTEYQKQRASELYDFYTKNGGNSYIHTEWDKARSNGLI